MTQHTSRHDLWIIAAGYLAAVHVGKLSPIIPILQKQLDLNLAQAGLALSLVQAAGMLFALCLGSFSEKVGLKQCFIAGLVILGCASLSGVFISSLFSLFFFRFFEGIGFLLITLTAPAILKRICDPQKMNVKMGIWGSYMGLGVGIAMLSIPLLLQYFSWQHIWFGLGLLCLGFAAIVQVLLHLPRTHSTQTSSLSFLSVVKMTLRHAPVVCLAIIFAAYTSQWLTVIGFLPSIYLNAKIDFQVAGILTALVSISNIAGTLAAGGLLHHGITAKKLIITGFLTMCTMCFVMFVFNQYLPFPIQYLSVIIFSAVGGLIPATVFAITLNYAPHPNAIAASVGLVLQISAFGQFILPPLSGMLVSYTHNWSNIVWITTALSLLGIGAVWQLFKAHPLKIQ